ncbi:MAG TPA: glyoxalase superfamily protein [Candidatus Acidoferrales bacterium]|jgi:uncharacterized glyoxalase superfamily protein PhnB|nr:glyoxalase superfamily protein [Candidatus Acidoferrales bacterium]
MKTKHVTPVFKVANLDKALSHYKDVLGFAEDFRIGNYAGVKLGSVSMHLAEQSEDDDGEYAKPIGGSTAYVLCDEVDSYFADIKNKGAVVKYPPKNWPYGMRDFRVTDPDGNHISFGCNLLRA